MMPLRRVMTFAAFTVFAAHIATLALLGTRASGPLLSNLLQALIAVIATVACLKAARRSGPYARRIWTLTTAALLIWIVAQFIITYYDSILHKSFLTAWPSDPLIFFWIVPLFMALFVDSEARGMRRVDFVQLLDFTQVMLLAIALHIATLYAPSAWAIAPHSMATLTADTSSIRDAILVLALFVRAYITRYSLVRSLFVRLGAFTIAYGLGDFLINQPVNQAVTGEFPDLLWTLPFVILTFVAEGWDRPDESVLGTKPTRIKGVFRVLALSAVFLPIPVLGVMNLVNKELPGVGTALLIATLVCSGLRLLVTEYRHDKSQGLQSALYRIAQVASTAKDLDQLYAAIHAILSDLMYAKNCYVALYDPETDMVSFPYFVDQLDEAPAPRAARRGLTEYVLRTGRPLLATPDVLEELNKAGEVARIGAASLDWMGVPLKQGDTVFGVLTLQTYEPNVRYGEREKEILSFVSQQVASVIAHKRSEQAVQESEANFRALAENASAAIYIYDQSGMLYVNHATELLTEYSRDELLGLDGLTTIIHPNFREGVIERMQTRFNGGSLTAQFEYQIVTKSGQIRWVDSSGNRIHFRGRPAVVGIAVDITERKRIEEQFRTAQKMEAIGRLSGGVAHDFNNLLTIIQMSNQMLRNGVQSNPELLEYADQIGQASDRAATLTRQLMAFSRQQVMQPRLIDLNTIVEGMDQMFRRILGEDINLETSMAADLGTVRADPGQIEQVIMNLVLNARDAMPSGGRLSLRTENVDVSAQFAQQHIGAQVGSFVRLTVTDTGVGMSPETKAHIFEPFFTTKPVGKGTGLGLSTVYGILQQSEGYVVVDSEPGRGTAFEIYLPRVYEPAEAPITAAARPSGSRGTETILLVEDEPSLRTLVHNILTRYGYRVITVEHASEVEEFCRGLNDTIHLLVTDVMMPGINGRDLAARLAVSRPAMRVLFISGYTEDAVLHTGMVAQGTHFLQKPFTPGELAAKVREVLDSSAKAAHA